MKIRKQVIEDGREHRTLSDTGTQAHTLKSKPHILHVNVEYVVQSEKIPSR